MGKDMKALVAFFNLLFGLLMFKLLPGVVELETTWLGLSELVWSGLLGSPGWSRGGLRRSSKGSSGLLRKRFLEGFVLRGWSNFEVGWLCRGEQKRETALNPPGTVWSWTGAFVLVLIINGIVIIKINFNFYTLCDILCAIFSWLLHFLVAYGDCQNFYKLNITTQCRFWKQEHQRCYKAS